MLTAECINQSKVGRAQLEKRKRRVENLRDTISNIRALVRSGG